MKKFKTWIIHLLGGVTEDQIYQSNINSAYVGAYQALDIIKKYADSLNGKPADEWCELVYKFICGLQERITHGTDEERPTAHP